MIPLQLATYREEVVRFVYTRIIVYMLDGGMKWAIEIEYPQGTSL